MGDCHATRIEQNSGVLVIRHGTITFLGVAYIFLGAFCLQAQLMFTDAMYIPLLLSKHAHQDTFIFGQT
jgi:hypothetical protein